VRPVHPVAFSSHLCTISYNTANILAMYKGTTNSPSKVWYGGDNLYWECPDRDDGHLSNFCNWKIEYLRGDKHCSCTKKWQQHLHTRPNAFISHSYASIMVILHILTYKFTLFPITCMHMRARMHTHAYTSTEDWKMTQHFKDQQQKLCTFFLKYTLDFITIM
jgi:hypothetical protein